MLKTLQRILDEFKCTATIGSYVQRGLLSTKDAETVMQLYFWENTK